MDYFKLHEEGTTLSRIVQDASKPSKPLLYQCQRIKVDSVGTFHPYTLPIGSYRSLIHGCYAASAETLHTTSSENVPMFLPLQQQQQQKEKIPQQQFQKPLGTRGADVQGGSLSTESPQSLQHNKQPSRLVSSEPANALRDMRRLVFEDAAEAEKEASTVLAPRSQLREARMSTGHVRVMGGLRDGWRGFQDGFGGTANRDTELWNWLLQRGLQHYMMILNKQGFSVEQLQAMTDEELQDIGVVTPSAIARIRTSH